MYWQKKFKEEKNPDEEIEKEILSVRSEHKDFGYRRLHAELVHNRNIHVNKKKVHRLVKKLKLQVTSYTNKSRKYNSYKGKVGKVAPNRINRRFSTSVPYQKITTDTTEFKYYHVDQKGRMSIRVEAPKAARRSNRVPDVSSSVILVVAILNTSPASSLRPIFMMETPVSSSPSKRAL